MRYVLGVLDPAGVGIPEQLLRSYESLPRARGLDFEWCSFSRAAVLTAWDDPWGDPLSANEGDWVAAGMVRLDNRMEVEEWAGAPGPGLTDLQLVLRLLARTGSSRIRDVLGDFGFVAWNGATRTLVAATDALGVKKLFYAQRKGLLLFASRAEALVLEEGYEPQYLAELIALCPLTPGLTVYAGVRRLPAGGLATLERHQLTLQRYWSPEEFPATAFTPELERTAPEVLRELLSASVRQRLTGNGDTWAQLSGGLDSSSVVSVAQWLAESGSIAHGVAGTVTFVDWQNTDGDEREYSDIVHTRWGVRNETIVDPPLWVNDEPVQPWLDQPRDSLVFSPRERQLCAIVRNAGGRVLLAGFGSDELFTGTIIFFADWLARGRVWSVARGLAHWAARGRVSFWEIVYSNALLPLIPRSLRNPASFDDGRLLPWVSEGAAQRYGLRSRTQAVTGSEGRFGHKYRDTQLSRLSAITNELDAGAIGDALEVRYPFLARPLVEFALRLPPELCARPHARKWVLRQAMRGILPEAVRMRVGKGGPTDLLVRSLTTQHAILAPLVQSPLLAELGLVDEARLRTAFETAPCSAQDDRNLSADVQRTLMVEAWLRIRSGRWPRGPSP